MNRLFIVTLKEIEEGTGEPTSRRMTTILSSSQLKADDCDLERLFELVNGAELKPDVV